MGHNQTLARLASRRVRGSPLLSDTLAAFFAPAAALHLWRKAARVEGRQVHARALAIQDELRHGLTANRSPKDAPAGEKGRYRNTEGETR